MSGAAAVQVNNKLPDGRQIRALEGTYTQRQMFTLHKSSLFVPANETIMSVKEHDQSIQSDAYNSVNVNGWWRTGEYGFYPKDFEKQDLPIGDKIVYVEDGISYTLNIPDVPVKVNGETVGLGAAIGMGLIPLEKLKIDQVDEKNFIVSVTDDFKPETDLKVIDIMRPRGWALIDADCYPLKSKPSYERVPEARYSYVKHTEDLDKKATGWHGSLVRCVYDFYIRRGVVACADWADDSGLALVGREATAPLVMSERTQLIISLLEATGVKDLWELNAAIISARAELNDLLKARGPESLPGLKKLLKILELPGLYSKSD